MNLTLLSEKNIMSKLNIITAQDQAAFEYLKDVILNEHGSIEWTFTPINAFNYMEAAVAEEMEHLASLAMTMY